MKPLQAVAMGYVVIALFARQGGYDLLADPVGWALVLLGVRRLPDPVTRPTLLYVGAVALVVSAALWVPPVLDAVVAEDPSIAWAAGLPALGFAALLFRELAGAARTAGDDTPATVLQGLVTLTVVVALLPVLVFGAGLEGLADLAGGSGQLLNLAAVAVLFSYSGRPWATDSTAAAPGGSGR